MTSLATHFLSGAIVYVSPNYSVGFTFVMGSTVVRSYGRMPLSRWSWSDRGQRWALFGNDWRYGPVQHHLKTQCSTERKRSRLVRIYGLARYSEQLRTLIISERVEISRLCLRRELRLVIPFYVLETLNQSPVPSWSFSRKTLNISRILWGRFFNFGKKIPETFFFG